MQTQRAEAKPRGSARSPRKTSFEAREIWQPNNSGFQPASNHHASHQSIYYSDQEADQSNQGSPKREKVQDENREASGEQNQGAKGGGTKGSKNWNLRKTRSAVEKRKRIQKKQAKGLANRPACKNTFSRELKNLASDLAANQAKKEPNQSLQRVTRQNKKAPHFNTIQKRTRLSSLPKPKAIKQDQRVLVKQPALKQSQIKNELNEQKSRLKQQKEPIDQIIYKSNLQLLNQNQEPVKEEHRNYSQRVQKEQMPNQIRQTQNANPALQLRQKTEAMRQKKKAVRQKTAAVRQKTEAERQKTAAERQKTEAERQKMEAERQKMEAERQKMKVEQPRQTYAGFEHKRKENVVVKTFLKDDPSYTQLNGDQILSNQQKFRVFQKIQQLNYEAKAKSLIYENNKKQENSQPLQKKEQQPKQAFAQEQAQVKVLPNKVTGLPNELPAQTLTKDEKRKLLQQERDRMYPRQRPSRFRRIQILDRYKYNPFQEEPRADQCLLWKTIMELITKKDLSPHFQSKHLLPDTNRQQVTKRFRWPTAVKIQEFHMPSLFQPNTNSLKFQHPEQQQPKIEYLHQEKQPSPLSFIDEAVHYQARTLEKTVKLQKVKEQQTENLSQKGSQNKQAIKTVERPNQNPVSKASQPQLLCQSKKKEDQESVHQSSQSFSFNLLQDFEVPSRIRQGLISGEMEEVRSLMKKQATNSQEIDAI